MQNFFIGLLAIVGIIMLLIIIVSMIGLISYGFGWSVGWFMHLFIGPAYCAVVLGIRRLFVRILALFRLMRGFSVLSIWGVLVFLSILRLSRKLLLLLSVVLLHPRVICLLLVLCFLSLVLHNHLLSMALS